MSDYGDFCREQREAKQKHRAHKAVENQTFVEQMIGFGFTYAPLPGGYRFSRKDFATDEMLRIDFWPASGKWTVVGTNVFNTSPSKMVHWVKSRTTKEGKIETDNAPTPKTVPWVHNPTGPGKPPWRD